MSELAAPARVLEIERFRRGAAAVVGVLREAPRVPIIILIVTIGVAVFADFISPHSPVDADLGRSMLPPAWMEGGSSSYLLGTDKWGRDILSRLIFGARISMSIAFLSIVVSGGTGTMLGLLSGYFGGRLDTLLMRTADVSLSFPSILIALILAVVIGPSFTNVIIIILIVYWPRFARQVRGETLSVKEQDYVILARSMGVTPWKIMWRHIFPNVTPSLLVLASFEVAQVVILEATLSFLGVGIPPPNPSWGTMVSDGRNYLEEAWWISLFAAIAIGLVVYSLNMTGDWVRDKLDPRLRQV